MRAATVLLVFFLGTALAGTYLKPEEVEREYSKDDLHKQKIIIELFRAIHQPPFYDSEFIAIAKEYKLEEHFNDFTNTEAVERFWSLYKHDRLFMLLPFTIFEHKMRAQAVALFKLFYYAKDFDTFYKTAVWARVHLNSGLFAYSYWIAVRARADTSYLMLPEPYEINPSYYIPSEVTAKAENIYMLGGIPDPEKVQHYGIFEKDSSYYIAANYTGWFNYYNEEQKLSYFTEDVGLNSFYYKFQMNHPFWMNETTYGDQHYRLGEEYFYIHQQLLARYYLERLANRMGEIPEFDWRSPIETGYYSSLENIVPLNPRDNYFPLSKVSNKFDVQFVEEWEYNFMKMIELKYAVSPDGKIHSLGEYKEGLEILFNYLQKGNKGIEKSYEIISRLLLGNFHVRGSETFVSTSALHYFDSSLRDPVFWQLYSRIMTYVNNYKESFVPYTKQELAFPGVKIEHVKVDKLVTYYEYFNVMLNNFLWSKPNAAKLESKNYYAYQPRLNHKKFEMTIDVASDKEVDAVVKIFLGPAYDSQNYAFSWDDNKYNFVEVDWFAYKLSQGKNTIVRSSDDYSRFSENAPSVYQLFTDMAEAEKGSGKFTYNYLKYQRLPHGLLLPKGWKSGFPVQFYVVIYPYSLSGEMANHHMYKSVEVDEKPLGYPLDRPIDETYFFQPNMYSHEALVYHHGDEHVHNYGKPEYFLNKDYNKAL